MLTLLAFIVWHIGATWLSKLSHPCFQLQRFKVCLLLCVFTTISPQKYTLNALRWLKWLRKGVWKFWGTLKWGGFPCWPLLNECLENTKHWWSNWLMILLVMLMVRIIMNFYVMWKLLWALLVCCLCWKQCKAWTSLFKIKAFLFFILLYLSNHVKLITTPCMWILKSNTLMISSKALWIWWCLKMMSYVFNGGLNHNHNWNLLFFSSSNIYTCTKLSRPLDGVNGGLKWLGLWCPKC